MIINKIDHSINNLIHSESVIKRTVVSRVAMVASTFLVILEAALRTIGSAITFTAYIISEPFFLTFAALRLGVDDEYKLKEFREHQEYYLNIMVLNPIAKAFTSTVCVILTPFVGVFSPKAAIQLHVDCGLTDPIVVPVNPQSAANKNVKKNEEFVIPELVKSDLKNKFLDFHVQSEKTEVQNALGVPAPNKLHLFGDSAKDAKQAALWIASELKKSFIDVKNFNKERDHDNLLNSVVFIDLTTQDKSLMESFILNLTKLGCVVITYDKFRQKRSTLPQTELCSATALEIENLIKNKLQNHTENDELVTARICEIVKGFKVSHVLEVIHFIKYEAATQKLTKITLEFVNGLENRIHSEWERKPKKSIDADKASDPIHPSEFIGLEAVTRAFDNHIEYLSNPEAAKAKGIDRLPGHIFLMGPPGVGKTYAAQKLPRYAESKGMKMSYMTFTAGDIMSEYGGRPTKNIKDKEREAIAIVKRTGQPVVLFIDESDSLMSTRTQVNAQYGSFSTERNSIVNQLIKLMDNARENKIIVVCATNMEKNIDAAILRDGRTDYFVHMERPSLEIKEQIFQAKIDRLPPNEKEGDFNIKLLMEDLQNADIATLEKIYRLAISNCSKNNGKLSQKHLLNAKTEIIGYPSLV